MKLLEMGKNMKINHGFSDSWNLTLGEVSEPYSGWAFLGLLADERGGGQKAPLPKISHTYPTMVKLGTVIPYLKKIQKLY